MANVRFESKVSYPPFNLAEDSPVVAHARKAVESLGLKPAAVLSSDGLDANWLVKHGVPMVAIGAGQYEIHTAKEYVDLLEFAQDCRLAVALATQEVWFELNSTSNFGEVMDSKTKQIGATLCLVAMAFFAGWPFWKWVTLRPVGASVRNRTAALVEKNPQLQLAWTVAMQDDVLTLPEAKLIVEAAGEKLDSEE